ncbi:hypothetical protein BLOT_009986 [Blomia tropicalis]|nr:hypothetical protein BLOT_009986 [Blomia tropicalis]
MYIGPHTFTYINLNTILFYYYSRSMVTRLPLFCIGKKKRKSRGRKTTSTKKTRPTTVIHHQTGSEANRIQIYAVVFSSFRWEMHDSIQFLLILNKSDIDFIPKSFETLHLRKKNRPKVQSKHKNPKPLIQSKQLMFLISTKSMLDKTLKQIFVIYRK